MSTGRIARYRDYERLMARHERDQRIRRLSKLIVYVLIVVILICTLLAVYIIRTNKPKLPNTQPKEAMAQQNSKTVNL
jgi:hypothetical protein